MAEFSELVVTDNGNKLLMKTIGNDVAINFTKLLTSSQIYSMEELEKLTALDEVKQQSEASAIDVENVSTITIHTIIPNTDLKEGYFLRTIGLYANDPDEGEILYGVSVETSCNGCYVPPYNNRTVSNIYFNISVAVGNSKNVILNVDEGAIVTVKQLNKLLYPEYKEAKDLIKLVSGESLFDLFGKIQRAVNSLISHIADKNNPHTSTKAQINLENVDNTSDRDKPVSTAQQAALDTYYQQSTGYTDNQIAALINGAPSTLDTLGEIAQAMQDNADVVGALDSAIGTKASRAAFDSHTKDTIAHVTETERNKWNNIIKISNIKTAAIIPTGRFTVTCAVVPPVGYTCLGLVSWTTDSRSPNITIAGCTYDNSIVEVIGYNSGSEVTIVPQFRMIHVKTDVL